MVVRSNWGKINEYPI